MHAERILSATGSKSHSYVVATVTLARVSRSMVVHVYIKYTDTKNLFRVYSIMQMSCLLAIWGMPV